MNWLRKFLGLEVVIEAKDSEIASLRVQLHNRDAMLELKDHEIQRLTNLILIEHGVIQRDVITSEKTGPPKAINRRRNWPSIQKDFEKADVSLAREQVDSIKKYWEDREVAQQNGLA